MKTDLFYADSRQLLEAVEQMKSEGCSLHHSAWLRGYVKRKEGFYTQYSGRFGRGYVVHWPNSTGSTTNNYHRVEYYLRS